MFAFVRSYLDTLIACVSNRPVTSLMILGPVFYSLFYPQGYALQRVERVPVVVVDADHSSISRSIIRDVTGAPNLRLLATVSDLQAANNLLADKTARGALFIPPDLERNVLRRRQTSVVILGNGAYPLLNRATSSTFTSIVLAQDAALNVRYRLAANQSRAEARAQSRPITLDSLNLFNPTQGYASSVIPAVAVLIVHQTLVIGIGVFLAGRRERGELPASSPIALVASILAFATIGFCTTLYWEADALRWWDLPHGGTLPDVLAFSALFALATAAFGFALGCCFDLRERAVQILMPSSVLLLFITGYPWPSNGIAAGLRALRWVFPSTAGIVGLTQICQMGASWAESAPEVIALAAITVAATALAFLQLRVRASRAER